MVNNKISTKGIRASVVIPTFNVIEAEPAIRNILQQDYKNKEIIVVNDNPKVPVPAALLAFIKKNKVKLINNKENRGIAFSINAGIAASTGQVILPFCGDYIALDKKWIQHIVDAMYSAKNVGVVVSDVRWPSGVWKKYDFLTKLMTFRTIDMQSVIGGAAGCYRKEIFTKLGYFDHERFAYCGEESDLYAKMFKAGYTLKVIKDVILHNHFSKKGKLSDMLLKEFRYGEGNGAIKRKYGLFRYVSLFDSHIRAALILLFLAGLFVYWPLSVGVAAIFLLATTVQSVISFLRVPWLPGLLLYPFAGLMIMLSQTAGAVYGYISGKADI